MNRILVLITLSDSSIETIKSTPELPKREMEFVNKWKQDNIWKVSLFRFQKKMLYSFSKTLTIKFKRTYRNLTILPVYG